MSITLASTTKYAGIGLPLIVVYVLGLAFFRLYPSPLAKIPGAKQAAVTSWYQRYFDLVAESYRGQFPKQIKVLARAIWTNRANCAG
jgi:hypothetical protein